MTKKYTFLSFSCRIPLWAGVLITITDTFVFLFLDKYGKYAHIVTYLSVSMCPGVDTVYVPLQA